MSVVYGALACFHKMQVTSVSTVFARPKDLPQYPIPVTHQRALMLLTGKTQNLDPYPCGSAKKKQPRLNQDLTTSLGLPQIHNGYLHWGEGIPSIHCTHGRRVESVFFVSFGPGIHRLETSS